MPGVEWAWVDCVLVFLEVSIGWVGLGDHGTVGKEVTTGRERWRI